MLEMKTREDKAVRGGGGASTEVVRALRDPATYPNEVRGVETIETHMSWIFLTEAHAYKLKKPIRTTTLDHTTIEARRIACDAELRLNRRLSRTVYLDVVAMVRANGRLRLEGMGTPIDWLVKMRRLPRDRMLDACIARGAVQGEELDGLADTLARFYEAAEPAPLTRAAYRTRIAADIEAKRASLEQPRYRLVPAEVQGLVAHQERWLARHGRLLEGRAGRVVDAHGDLRPEHICLERAPVVIDCLEFDRELRILDPVSELSFLALECRLLGAAWIGDRLLARYEEKSGDHVPGPLVPFYESYHALVRAAVAIWHLDDSALRRSDVWRERCSRYLQVGRELLARVA